MVKNKTELVTPTTVFKDICHDSSHGGEVWGSASMHVKETPESFFVA